MKNPRKIFGTIILVFAAFCCYVSCVARNLVNYADIVMSANQIQLLSGNATPVELTAAKRSHDDAEQDKSFYFGLMYASGSVGIILVILGMVLFSAGGQTRAEQSAATDGEVVP